MLRGRGRGTGRGWRLGLSEGRGEMDEIAGTTGDAGDAGVLERGAGTGVTLGVLGAGRWLGSSATFPMWMGRVSKSSGYFRAT